MALLGTLTTSVSALDSFTTGLDTIGNNIANINTTAFKGSDVSFADTFSAVGTRVNSTQQSFTQGALTSTGSPTDLGISGNGFFVVKDATSSTPFATRDGQFHFDASGFLVNEEGYQVQGLVSGSAASLKLGTPPSGAALASVAIDTSGHVIESYSDGSQATTGQVLLESFSNPQKLQSQGNNLFANLSLAGPSSPVLAMTAAANAPGTNGLGTVQSGTLEQSNVDLTQQFSNLITMQRAFEANSRMITISDTILQDVVDMKSH